MGAGHRSTPRALAIVVLVSAAALGCKKPPAATAADLDFYRKVQEQLILAKPGAVIELPEGTFRLTRSLSSTVDGITLRGKGMDKTILSFKGQTEGAEGILVKGNRITIEDLAIEDAKGDALKVSGSDGLVIRRVRAEWTRGPNEENGAYGIYPVQCRNVLIEDSVAVAASDAGLYVGQSENVLIRRNKARKNVAGLESENSRNVVIRDTVVTENTGGILVFDLPDLPVQGGRNVQVFDNDVRGNNTDNFAPKGNIVATVPPGTGIMVMANDEVELFRNRIEGHRTVNLAVVSYHITGKPLKDERYDPFPEGIYIHDNTFVGGGESPSGLLVQVLALKLGKPFPDILYDGIVDKKKLGTDGALPERMRLCIQNNGDADFVNMDAANKFKNIRRELSAHDCAHPTLAAVQLPGVE